MKRVVTLKDWAPGETRGKADCGGKGGAGKPGGGKHGSGVEGGAKCGDKGGVDGGVEGGHEPSTPEARLEDCAATHVRETMHHAQ